MPFLKSKYFITIIVFILWMAFIDQYDLKTIFSLREDLKEIEQSNEYYEEQIIETRSQLEDLKDNPDAIEKFARERYLMKKEDEDIFIISKEKQ